MRRRLVVLAILASVLAPPALAGRTQEDLRSRWLGAWVVLTSQVSSDCSGFHTNNEIHGELSLGGGAHRFEPGELGQVTGVDLKRARVDVFVQLQEDLLVPYQDGPFELYREATCRVELLVDLPRAMVKGNDVEGIDRLIRRVADRHASADEAMASDRWNERQRDPYPPDYENRLARHAAWKAQQHNDSVTRKIEAAMDTAQTVLARVSNERPGYGEAFALGVEAMSAKTFDDCGRMLGSSFSSWKSKPPEGVHEEGYLDGQMLAYSVRVADRLKRCYVDVPPAPEDTSVATLDED